MANNANQLVVSGDGAVYIAPVGTTLPTTTAASLNAAFDDLGYISEDGVTFNHGKEVGEFMAWQSAEAVRREVISRSFVFEFEMAEWNEYTVALAYGATLDDSGAETKLVFPTSGDALPEWAMVVDVTDGTRDFRFVIPRGTADEDVETQFQRSELAVLPATFKALTPSGGGPAVIVYTNDTTAFPQPV